MIENLFQALTEDDCILTVNHRLSRLLLQRYHNSQAHSGRRTWCPPQILPWSVWVENAFNTPLLRSHYVLPEHHEIHLWDEIIRQDDLGASPLLQRRATARAVARAWWITRQWGLTVAPDASHPAEVHCFLKWAGRFEARCRQEGFLTRAELPDEVARLLRAKKVPAPRRVILMGFDEISPQQESVHDALREAGCQVESFVWQPPHKADPVRVALKSQEEEIRIAALWARDLLAKSPRQRIGIVVPDLEKRRTMVERTFSDVLDPAAVLPGLSDRPRQFNISLGYPLADMPMVHDALLALKVASDSSTTVDRASCLLRSPYFLGENGEIAARSLLDCKLRDVKSHLVGLEDLRDLARGRAPQLEHILTALLDAQADFGGQHLPSAWVERLVALLADTGWPGRHLNSTQYQAAQAWKALLDELCGLDGLVGRVDFRDIVGQVAGLARRTIFQPETEDVPIQIMGMLETGGLVFDCLWVMGLNDEVWPAPSHPSPFLPMALQRSRGLPHATAARELEFATVVTERLKRSACTVVFSYPQRDGDRILAPSALIADLPERDPATLVQEWSPGLAEALAGTAALESFSDDTGPACAPHSVAAGGSGMFEDQAACPCRSFVLHRLKACSPVQESYGLDAADRGTLVHNALAWALAQINDWNNLRGMSDEILDGIARDAAHWEVQSLRRKRPHVLGSQFARLEEDRIARIVREWLVLEKGRAPFEVLEVEREHTFTVDGIEVHTKIDRIDRTNLGKVIIDYKTGVVDWRDWFGDRPDAPQLPLYTVMEKGEVAAVLFAQIRLNKMSFQGVARADNLVPGVPDFRKTPLGRQFATWEELIDSWRRQIDALMHEFKDGVARVCPKNAEETCKHCDVKPVCRIDEINRNLIRRGETDDDEAV